MDDKLINTNNSDADRLRAIIDGSNLGTWEWNTQTNETIFNEQWANIIGYTLEEISPVSIQTWERFSHPDDLKKSNKMLKKCFDGNLDFYNIELRMKHKDGHWVWILDRGKVSTWTQDGSPEWISGTHQEISKRKDLQKQLKQSEENFKTFFNSNLDFLWVLDEKANIIKANKTVVERLGYSEDELAGKSVLSVHPEKRQTEALNIVSAMLEGTAESCPIPLITKTGTQIPVETYVYPGQWDGRPALFGTSRDISKLKFSEEKFSKAFETNSAIAGLSDLETGEYMEVNSSFYETLGFNKEEVIGKKALDLLQLDPAFREATISEMNKGGSIRNIETILLRKDGTPLNVLLSADVINIQDKSYNFTTAINITKQKTAEAELRKSLQEKEMLMKEMNHRIKNNLFMISSLISLEDANPDREANLIHLKNRIDAIGLIHETLYKTEVFSHVNIREYLNHLLEKIFLSISNNEVIVDNKVAEIDFTVKSIIPIGLIVNEIATNAVKYSFNENTDAVFRIEMPKPGKNNMIDFKISNNGKPFSEEINLEDSKTLGLQLIKNLTRQLKGELTLIKQPHPEFTIRFPGEINVSG